VGQDRVRRALDSAALLLGRRSDEWFGTRWAARPGQFADRLNSLPKYVVSATLRDPRWTNVTVLKGDVTDEVTRLKRELDGDIVVYASYQLERALIEHGSWTSCGCSSSRSWSGPASGYSARPPA